MKRLALAAAVLLLLPAAAQARPAWSFNREGGNPTLLMIDPEDGGEGDVPTLSCSPRTGQVTALAFTDSDHFHLHTANPQSMVQLDEHNRPGPWPARLTVSSGPVSAVAVGRAEYGGEMNATTMVRGVLPLASPVIRAFAASGRIRFVAYGQDAQLIRVPMPLVSRFMAACRR
jgi:hypothetical protein